VKKYPQILTNSTVRDPVTPDLARKKSVTFTPETKVEDGDSIKQLFNSWVADQKEQVPSFELKSSNPVVRTLELAQGEEQVDATLDEKDRRVKRVKKPQQETTTPRSKLNSKVTKSTTPSTPRPFLQYLKQYHESRGTWKFNKNHQNHLLKHAFDVSVVPSDYAYLLYEYVRGLQGGVRTRLRDTALAIKVKDQEDGPTGFPANMPDKEQRQRDYDAAMKEYVATMTAASASSNIGYEEGVLLGLSDKAMEKRATRRMRSERILAELGEDRTSITEAATNGDEDNQKRLRMSDGGAQKLARKRKQRTVVMDDETSSSESSSDSEGDGNTENGTARDDDDDDDDDDTSSSSSSSSSESGSGSEDAEETSESDSEESDSD
jgi:hypothetical protein